VLVVISRVEARSDTLFTRRCTRRRGVCVCRKDACQDNEQRGTQTHVRGSRRLTLLAIGTECECSQGFEEGKFALSHLEVVVSYRRRWL